MANLDGTELIQLTEDGTLKSSLQWHPDGESITYIVGKCIYRLWVDSGEVEPSAPDDVVRGKIKVHELPEVESEAITRLTQRAVDGFN